MTSHRLTETWMGEETETLADLLRPGLRAVCVGINPAPSSVAAGHYYQGQLGQRFLSRLRDVGAIPPPAGGWADDEAYAAGVGFTDIVKRPTASTKALHPREYQYGKEALVAKLEANRPEIVIFTFKKTATVLLDGNIGNGFVGRQLGGADVFIMPGPYEKTATAVPILAELRERLGNERGI